MPVLSHDDSASDGVQSNSASFDASFVPARHVVVSSALFRFPRDSGIPGFFQG